MALSSNSLSKLMKIKKTFREIGLDDKVIEGYEKIIIKFGNEEVTYEKLDGIINRLRGYYNTSEEFKTDFDEWFNSLDRYFNNMDNTRLIIPLIDLHQGYSSNPHTLKQITSTMSPELDISININIGVFLNDIQNINEDLYDSFCSTIRKYHQSEHISKILTIFRSINPRTRSLPREYLFSICDILSNNCSDKLIEELHGYAKGEGQSNGRDEMPYIYNLVKLVKNGANFNEIDVNTSTFFNRIYFEIEDKEFRGYLSSREINNLTKAYCLCDQIMTDQRYRGMPSFPHTLFKIYFRLAVDEAISYGDTIEEKRGAVNEWAVNVYNSIKNNPEQFYEFVSLTVGGGE